MIFLYILLSLIFLLFAFLLLKNREVNAGKIHADKMYKETVVSKIHDTGSVKTLTILPLVDSEAIDDRFKTENGVSYLIKADNKKILLDVGFNKKGEKTSPLLHNMNSLRESLDNVDAMIFSHAHLDHLGGVAEQKNKTFSLTHSKLDIESIPVYAPIKLNPSRYNPQLTDVRISTDPTVISPGIYTSGTIPRYLFIMGYVEEQALAIRMEGKGIVLILGCGHQTIQKLIERSKKLFNEPIYAVIGGLHLPILKKGHITASSIVQWIVGSDAAPWKGLNDEDVRQAIAAIQAENVKIVALSPHDSSAWSISEFKKAFGDRYVDVKVGKHIQL